MIRIIVSGTHIHGSTDNPVTSGSVGLPVQFSFDSAWDGLQKMAIFHSGDIKVSVLIKDDAIVPWEVLQTAGGLLRVGVYGSNSEGTVVIPTIWANVCKIDEGAKVEGDDPTEPTPPVWAALSKDVEDLEKQVSASVKTVNGIKPDEKGNVELTGQGGPGEDGFTPIATVTETSSGAVISITDKNGTTTATIKNGQKGDTGAAGKDGKTPVKGTDYYTAADKAEMVNAVIAALPIYNGEVEDV